MATIVNNGLTSPESVLRINNPLMYIPDPTKSDALALASLYFGEVDRDPQLAENQKRVYAIQENGSLVPLQQPVKTTAGGIPEYNGSPVSLAIDGSYSFKVLDSNDAQVYYFPTINNNSLVDSGLESVIEDVITTTLNQTEVIFPNVDVTNSVIDISGSGVDNGGLFRDVDYVVTDGSAGKITLTSAYPAGTLIRARQNATTAQSLTDTASVVFSSPTVQAAKTVNYNEGDTVIILGDALTTDGLGSTFEVVSTGSPDGVNIITMDNGLFLRRVSSKDKVQTFTEAIASPVVLSGVLTLNMDAGTVFNVNLSENVSSIVFGNVNTQGVTTITVKFTQTVDINSVDFAGIKFASGTAPTITATDGAEDIIVFSTYDGLTWYGFVAGQDFS